MIPNVAVLASGAGTTFDHLATLSSRGLTNWEINGLFTNNSQAGCVDVAVKHKIMSVIVTPDNVFDLLPENTDLVVLAGWLKLLNIQGKWWRKVLNIHPSLLPKYGGEGMYGMNVHKAVIANQERESGCTVHIVDNIYDNGEIIAQKKVRVEPFDTPMTLCHKVQNLEREVYPKAISKFVEQMQLPF